MVEPCRLFSSPHEGRNCHAGPCPAFILPFVLRGGETMENGKISFAGSIRHRTPELCPQGAMGQHLIMRFTLDSEPFPDPRDAEEWLAIAMWPAGNCKKNVSYQQMADALNYYLRVDLGFNVRKVTHIFRVLGARLLDEQGIDDAVSSTSVLISAVILLLCDCSPTFIPHS